MSSVSWNQVTAWRLKRGHLTRRLSGDRIADVVAAICGAHAQILSSVALALNARVSGLAVEQVDTAMNFDRSLIKTWLMRGTLHVVSADDLPLYCAALGATQTYDDRTLEYLELKVADVEAVLDAIPQALDAQVLTRDELADAVVRLTKRNHLLEHLRSGWGSLLKPAALKGLLCFGPPSGRSVTFVRPDQWVGRWKTLDSEEALREVFRRFLRAYGPATKGEVARWLGVSPAAAGRALGSMESELIRVRVGDADRILLESDRRSLRATKPAASVRLLPSFDQLLVMSAPHSEAIVDPEYKKHVYRQRVAVWSLPSVMIDGRVLAAWKLDRKKKAAIVSISPFNSLPRAAKPALEEEVQRIGALFDTEAQLEIVGT